MTTSAIIMLIFGVAVLYGGLYITVNKAYQASKEREEG